MKIQKKCAFTLVELIVVIVILGFLSTIGFVSYNGYLGGARDSNRISALKGINDSLNLYQTKNDLPFPENYVTVTASGTILGYQGYAGKNILEIINYTNGGQDPKDNSYYTYYLTNDRKNFQLLGFLEEAENLQSNLPRLTHQVQAADYTNRFPKVFGKKLGVLTQATTNTPIQDLNLSSSTLDIVNTGSSYNAHINDGETISGTGASLEASLWNGSCQRLVQTGNFKGNGLYQIIDKGKIIDVFCHQNFLDTTFYTEIRNPGFEENIPGKWYSTYLSPSANHTGGYGVQVSNWQTLVGDDYIYIDNSKSYTISGYFRSQGSGNSRIYFGFSEYDEDFEPIRSHHVNIAPGTETTLTQAVSETSTSITFSDVDGSMCSTWSSHPRFGDNAVVAFNIDDSGNYNDLPNRNTSTLYTVGEDTFGFVNIVDNGTTCTATYYGTIGQAFPAGTKIRMHIRAGAYNYVAASGNLVPNTWTYFSGTVAGEQLYGINNSQFRRGAKFIKILTLSNYKQYSGEVMQLDDIKLEIQ